MINHVKSLSKIYIYIAPVCILLSIEENISLVSFRRVVVVEKYGLNPDWYGDRMSKLIMGGRQTSSCLFALWLRINCFKLKIA